jgi:hypothetical protein
MPANFASIKTTLNEIAKKTREGKIDINLIKFYAGEVKAILRMLIYYEKAGYPIKYTREEVQIALKEYEQEINLQDAAIRLEKAAKALPS